MQPTTPSATSAALRTVDDAGLLAYIAAQADNDQLARAAFQVFYTRYERYVFAVTRQACAAHPGSSHELFEAVYQNTFMRVFTRAATFDPNKVTATDLTTGIKAWLGRVADNELKQLLRERTSQPPLQLTAEVALFEDGMRPDLPEDAASPVSLERQLLDQALATLSERDRYILLQSMAYEQEGKYLPSTFINDTCALFGITKPNLRKIKSTAYEKVLNKITQLQQVSATSHAKSS